MGFNWQNDSSCAIEVIEKNKSNGFNYSDFSYYSPCYKFSNENLSDYYKRFNINGGDVLSVCGSGDQVLSAFVFGAESVDCFDSNILSFYNLLLKFYSIINLSYNDFLYFYGLTDSICNRKVVFDSFKNSISDDNTRLFWDTIFNSGLDSNFFYNNSAYHFEDLFYTIPYLDVNNYYKLKSILDVSKLKLVACDIFKIFEHFSGMYDFINFSNICDYVSDLPSFYLLVNKIRNQLNSNGGIVVNYSWAKPYCNQRNNEIAQELDAFQEEIRNHKYNDEFDSIVYIKK